MSPQLVSKLYIFSRGLRVPWNLEALLPGEQQETRPKRKERVVNRMTDARWAPAASLLLPTSLHSPKGSDQKAHAILALFCF